MALAEPDGAVTRVNRALCTLLGREAVELLGAALDELFPRPVGAGPYPAEAASRAKSDFVAALGHELRTPLQAVTGFTELLRTIDLPPERRAAALEHIESASAHILSMVDDVLDVVRIEAGGLPLQSSDVDLHAVVVDVLALLGPLAAAGRVTLRRSGSAGWVRADPRRCRQVLLNLVTNAIRYNRPGGAVDVEVVPDGGDVTVTVRDTGVGIATAHLARLFAPFDRLGADDDQGVGLGLPLVRGLTEAMGGCLSVESTVGRGTVVTVPLPAVSGPATGSART
jgi:signal transduction histidine kinase